MKRNKILNDLKACLSFQTGFFVLVLTMIMAVSCRTSVNQGNVQNIMPNITGTAGEVLVVMDQFNWDNSAGEHLKDVLKKEIVGLPQSEPLFDVIQITSASFDGIYKFHRNVVLTSVSSGIEPKVSFKENVWAKPQLLVRIEAPSSAELSRLITENHARIQSFLVQYDRKRLMNVYKESKDLTIQKQISEHHQVSLSIPRGYNMDFSKDEYTSVSIESPDLSQVVQIFEYPVSGPDALQTRYLLERRNQFTKKYVQGPYDSTYMQISPLFQPAAYDLQFDGKQVVELRGLWELEKGFMGGPFISHSIYDAERNRIVTVDAYLYHPNEKKRVKLKQLEAIVYSLELF